MYRARFRWVRTKMLAVLGVDSRLVHLTKTHEVFGVDDRLVHLAASPMSNCAMAMHAADGTIVPGAAPHDLMNEIAMAP